MCRRAHIALEPTPQAASEARRFVTSTCDRWGIHEAHDEISLAVSELVTNAVLHAKTDIEVSIAVSCERPADDPDDPIGRAEVAVRDHDPRPPVLRPVRVDLLSDIDSLLREKPVEVPPNERDGFYAGTSGSIAAGRGLLIVDALADEWGVAERADGKEVWFTLPVQWESPHPCPCGDARTATASGRHCRHVEGPWDSPN